MICPSAKPTVPTSSAVSHRLVQRLACRSFPQVPAATARCCRILRSTECLRHWPNGIASSPWIARALVTRVEQGLTFGHQTLRLNSCTRRSFGLTSNKRRGRACLGNVSGTLPWRSTTQPTCEALVLTSGQISQSSALMSSHPRHARLPSLAI